MGQRYQEGGLRSDESPAVYGESSCATRHRVTACVVRVTGSCIGGRAPASDGRAARHCGTLPAAMKVLILGGYGTFGGRLAQLLADEARLTLIIAGRSRAKAQAFCDA